jgi:hypothetical protein
MKKVLSLIIASLCLLGLCSNYAFAANPYEDLEDTACSVAGFEDDAICERQGGNEESEAMGRVGTTLNVIYGLVGVIAVVFVVIGGFKFTTSQGDPGRVQQAKNTIMFSLIGLVVVIGAFAITSFVLTPSVVQAVAKAVATVLSHHLKLLPATPLKLVKLCR